LNDIILELCTCEKMVSSCEKILKDLKIWPSWHWLQHLNDFTWVFLVTKSFYWDTKIYDIVTLTLGFYVLFNVLSLAWVSLEISVVGDIWCFTNNSLLVFRFEDFYEIFALWKEYIDFVDLLCCEGLIVQTLQKSPRDRSHPENLHYGTDAKQSIITHRPSMAHDMQQEGCNIVQWNLHLGIHQKCSQA
jgi:hypothetical protein